MPLQDFEHQQQWKLTLHEEYETEVLASQTRSKYTPEDGLPLVVDPFPPSISAPE